MKTTMRSNAVRMLAMLVLGLALGLVAGARLFGPTGAEAIQSASEPGTSVYKVQGAAGPQAAPTRSSFPRRERRDASVSGPPASDAPPTLQVSTEILARVPISAFAPRRGNSWAKSANRFELTGQVRDLLGIDEKTAEDVRNVLEKARADFMQSGWQVPASVAATENGAAITIAPSSAEARNRIAEELGAVLGEQSADLLLEFSGEALDWEFGDFGRLERVLEVTRLPDDTLSIRESLRPSGRASQNAAPAVERRVNQYRVETLPPELARFIQLGDSQ